MPDISRRTILAGLLAAPVAVPAAVVGMVKAKPANVDFWAESSYPDPDVLRRMSRGAEFHFTPSDANMGHVHINGLPLRNSDGGPLKAGDLRPGESTTVRLDYGKGEARLGRPVRAHCSSQPATVRHLVEIDPDGADEHVELEIDLGQTEGHSADVLDQDVATYAVPA